MKFRSDLLEKARGFLLDLDGTLIESEALHWESALGVLRELGCGEDDLPGRAPHGWNEDDHWRAMKRRFGIDQDEAALADMRSRCFVALVASTPPRLAPGAEAFLELLARRNTPRIIVSASRRDQIEALVRGTGIDRHVGEWVSTFDDVTRDKPHPDGYLEAARRIGVPPEQCVALEDAPNGARAALDAGATLVLIPSQTQPGLEPLRARAHVEIRSLADLLEPSRTTARR